MKILFEQIKADNFLSLGHASLDLSQPGITLISGENKCDSLSSSNGAGKSSLFEAILWCLTGNTSRGSSCVSNRATGKPACTELSFSLDGVPYTVIRRADPSALQIFRDGNDISGNTFTKSKKILSDILGYINYDMLASVIILTQGLGGRLSSLRASDRKARLEMFSSLQELIENATAQVSETVSGIAQSLADASAELASAESRIQRNRDLADGYQAKIDDLKQNQGKVLTPDEESELQADIAKHEGFLETCERQLSQAAAEQAGTESRIRELQARVNTLSAEIQKNKTAYASLLNSVCPTCGQAVHDPSLAESYASRITALMGEIEEAQSERVRLTETLGVDLVKPLRDEKARLNEFVRQSRQILSDSAKYSASAGAWEDMIRNLQEDTRQTEDKIFPLRTKISALSKDAEIAKWYRQSISRQFRNFLLDNVIGFLNRRLARYSAYLFSDRKVRLESDGSSLAIMLGDLEFENLSGGEGRRADLLIQLALRDLAINQSGFFCNLLVMDEVFDYLDDTGIDSFMLMLDRESSFSESLMVITHRKGINLPVARTATVTKNSQGVSSVSVSREQY